MKKILNLTKSPINLFDASDYSISGYVIVEPNIKPYLVIPFDPFSVFIEPTEKIIETSKVEFVTTNFGKVPVTSVERKISDQLNDYDIVIIPWLAETKGVVSPKFYLPIVKVFNKEMELLGYQSLEQIYPNAD